MDHPGEEDRGGRREPRTRLEGTPVLMVEWEEPAKDTEVVRAVGR